MFLTTSFTVYLATQKMVHYNGIIVMATKLANNYHALQNKFNKQLNFIKIINDLRIIFFKSWWIWYD